MPSLSSTSGIVVPFPIRPRWGEHLTVRDRLEIREWQDVAHSLGYDRLLIHEQLPYDPPDVGNFLSVYKAGEKWASWGLARRGGAILMWSCSTGTDVGRFRTVSEALRTIFPTPAHYTMRSSDLTAR